MKLMFNKKEYYGKYFDESKNNNDINEYTEKVPPNNGYFFDEELNDWVLNPVEDEDEDKEENEEKLD